MKKETKENLLPLLIVIAIIAVIFLGNGQTPMHRY